MTSAPARYLSARRASSSSKAITAGRSRTTYRLTIWRARVPSGAAMAAAQTSKQTCAMVRAQPMLRVARRSARPQRGLSHSRPRASFAPRGPISRPSLTCPTCMRLPGVPHCSLLRPWLPRRFWPNTIATLLTVSAGKLRPPCRRCASLVCSLPRSDRCAPPAAPKPLTLQHAARLCMPRLVGTYLGAFPGGRAPPPLHTLSSSINMVMLW